MQALKGKTRELILIVFIVVVGGIVAFISPQFLTLNNMMNLLRTNSVNGIMALGMMFLMVTGNFDISVGPSMMVCGGVITELILKNMPEATPFAYVLPFVVSIAVGIVIGLINGFFTAYFNLSSIVVTLGTFSIFSGTISIISGGSWTINFPYWFTSMTSVSIGGVYVSIWLYALVVFLSYFLLNRLNIGRRVLAFGGNPVSAMRAGFSKMKITLFVFALMGATVGLASVLMVSSNAFLDPTAGAGYELDLIAIVILGGAALNGGQATVAGTVLATLLIGVINNAIVFAGVPIYFQKLFVGSMILLSVVFTALQKRAGKRKKEMASASAGEVNK